MENRNLFVVTGGPGCGKTTVLRELEKRGFPFAPEVARQIIQEQVRTGGPALPWADRELYTKLMLERSIESYEAHTPASQLMFSDRGIPDTLGYARLIGLKDESAIRDACEKYCYARQVFFAPAWKEIYETDEERKQTFAEVERTCAQIAEVYEECGYKLVELPKVAPVARANFILESSCLSETRDKACTSSTGKENKHEDCSDHSDRPNRQQTRQHTS
jgi:predicted ATPase